MSEFSSVDADELVTKQFLRVELAELETADQDGGTDIGRCLPQGRPVVSTPMPMSTPRRSR